MNWTWFHRFGSAPYMYGFAQRWAPWFGGAAVLLMVIALYGGLVLAPLDYQQKDAYRIVYVHAPSATLSLAIYTTMAIAAAVGLIWRMKVAHAAAAASAPIGAWFTVAALAGTPMANAAALITAMPSTNRRPLRRTRPPLTCDVLWCIPSPCCVG